MFVFFHRDLWEDRMWLIRSLSESKSFDLSSDEYVFRIIDIVRDMFTVFSWVFRKIITR